MLHCLPLHKHGNRPTHSGTVKRDLAGVTIPGVDQIQLLQAAAAQAFLEQRLRMEDVRRYLLDTLRLYASLQTFQVGTMALDAVL